MGVSRSLQAGIINAGMIKSSLAITRLQHHFVKGCEGYRENGCEQQPTSRHQEYLIYIYMLFICFRYGGKFMEG